VVEKRSKRETTSGVAFYNLASLRTPISTIYESDYDNWQKNVANTWWHRFFGGWKSYQSSLGKDFGDIVV